MLKQIKKKNELTDINLEELLKNVDMDVGLMYIGFYAIVEDLTLSNIFFLHITFQFKIIFFLFLQ